jgi:hypothetical protein
MRLRTAAGPRTSPMRLRPALLLLCAALAGVCAAVILNTPAGSPERAVAAFLLVMVLPGVALTELLPASPRGPGAAAAVSVALSVSATVLASVGLYFAGVRLDLDSWTVTLTAITVLAAAGAAVRRGPVALPWAGLRARPAPALVVAGLGAAVLLAGAAGLTVRSVSDRTQRTRFTQLWALPPTGGASAATIGIYNHQGASRRYELRVYSNGRLVRSQLVLVPDRGSFTTTETPPAAKSADLRVTIAVPGRLENVYRWVQVRVGGAGTA